MADTAARNRGAVDGADRSAVDAAAVPRPPIPEDVRRARRATTGVAVTSVHATDAATRFANRRAHAPRSRAAPPRVRVLPVTVPRVRVHRVTVLRERVDGATADAVTVAVATNRAAIVGIAPSASRRVPSASRRARAGSRSVPFRWPASAPRLRAKALSRAAARAAAVVAAVVDVEVAAESAARSVR